jgi:hypothetical protein
MCKCFGELTAEIDPLVVTMCRYQVLAVIVGCLGGWSVVGCGMRIAKLAIGHECDEPIRLSAPRVC